MPAAWPGRSAGREGGPNPELETTKSPPKPRSTVPLTYDDAEVIITLNNVTTATPTINAAAVDAVRRGLRVALSRASAPGTPPMAASGAPRNRPIGRATTGPR